MEWTPRFIANQEVEHPYRYNVYDKDTGLIKYTADIVPTWQDNPEEIIQNKTEIDDIYLQPIEDYLKSVSDALPEIDISLFAPILNAELINPTRNTLPQTNNSQQLAYTAWVRTYFAALMAAYTG